MNMEEARRVLLLPLRFGDGGQIAARDYLEHLAEVRTRLMRCPRCEGLGVRATDKGRRVDLCRCVATEPPEVRRDLGVPAHGGPTVEEDDCGV